MTTTFEAKPTDLELDDEALLDILQRAAFDYFLTHVNPRTGLVADTSRANAPASIAVVGFALSCYPIGVVRGWLTRDEAATKTVRTLRFFMNSTQSDAADATGHRGFYYHFIDMESGTRSWTCELSMVDTAILLAGMMAAAVYFDSPTAVETEIRFLAEAVQQRVDWSWAMNGTPTLSQGWKPESGFLHYGWEGYNEAILLYALALGSPHAGIDPHGYAVWCETYQWERIYGHDVLYSGPLFTHLFSHAWIDFRAIQDDFMREKRFDYHRNTCAAIAIQREYAQRNPRGYRGYGADCWGFTAGDGPSAELMRRDKLDLRASGYAARGVPFGPDDGTIAPWAMLASLPFEPKAALEGTRFLLRKHPQTCRNFKFPSGFNLNVEGPTGWVSEGLFGLDQGLVVLMIENSRSGMMWQLMRRCGPLRLGLKRAGFRGGWLDESAA